MCCPSATGSASRRTKDPPSNEPGAARDRQQELLVVVDATLARVAEGRDRVRGNPYLALHRRAPRQDFALCAVRQSADPDRGRPCDLGVPRDTRVSRRAPPLTVARRSERACPRALAQCGDALGLSGITQPVADELPRGTGAARSS